MYRFSGPNTGSDPGGGQILKKKTHDYQWLVNFHVKTLRKNSANYSGSSASSIFRPFKNIIFGNLSVLRFFAFATDLKWRF